MPETTRNILAIDPGSAKCGIAVVSSSPIAIVERGVVPAGTLIAAVRERVTSHPVIETILIGDGTGSGTAIKGLREAFPSLTIIPVNEKNTSLRARERYCRENAAKGWRRFLPAGLRTPEECYDDYVAVILAEDWLSSSK